MKSALVCITILCVSSPIANAVEWPLKQSDNRRYLVDQDEKPFYILGETIWRIQAEVSPSDYDLLLDNIVEKGFTAVGVNALGFGDEWWDDGQFDASYFETLDTLVQKCKERELLFIAKTVNKAIVNEFSNSECFEIGQYLGSRYRASNGMGNVIFSTGLDGGGNNPRWEQIARGILDANPEAIITHHDRRGESSGDIWGDKPWLTLNAIYTHHPPWWRSGQPYPYVETWDNWNRFGGRMPLFEFEAVYEKEHMPAGNTVNMRKQHWWLATSGNVNGHFYGHRDIFQFAPAWKQTIHHAEFRNQLVYMKRLFDRIAWWKLVPDTNDNLVLVGNKGAKATRVTASLAEDGSFALFYTPEGLDPEVDMNQFSRDVFARWYNPSDGTTAHKSGPHKDDGRKTFRTPNDMHDWVLLLDVGAPRR